MGKKLKCNEIRRARIGNEEGRKYKENKTKEYRVHKCHEIREAKRINK